MSTNYVSFIAPLIHWYFFNKREFPWRTQLYTDKNLWIYHTWICEVMSQQTLISVVLPKFKNFILELPNIEALANCSDDILRSLWSGLGYYARARNLRNGAKFILHEFKGEFPSSKKEWLRVPGCGEYTAAIISSICFSEPVPAIDGNMIRVASRLLALEDGVWEKSGQQKISQFMTKSIEQYFKIKDPSIQATPGDFNQAFMDLGSMICKKQNPLCGECPLQNSCLAYKQKKVHLCPPIKPRAATQNEDIFALALYHKETKSVLMVEREMGFLSKTVGFPLFAQKEGFSLTSILNKTKCKSIDVKTMTKTFRHQITHHKMTGHVSVFESNWNDKKVKEFYSALSSTHPLPLKKYWIPFDDLGKHLSSSLDQKVLKLLS